VDAVVDTIERTSLLPDYGSLIEEVPDLQASREAQLRAADQTHRPVRKGSLGRRGGVLLAGLWVVTISTIVLTEPAPSNPDAAVPAWTLLLGGVALSLMPLVFVGVLTRARWGFTASLAAAAAFLVLAVGCFATAHHAGLYPYGEAAAFALIGSLSWRGLRRG
jgi:hypothetical protein